MTQRFFVALFAIFSLFHILGIQRAPGQINPDPKLVEGAKKEGEMIFYTTMTLDQSKEVVDRFQKKYPFVKPTLFLHGRRPAPEQDLYRSSRRQACLGCGGGKSGNGRAAHAAKTDCLLPLTCDQHDR